MFADEQSPNNRHPSKPYSIQTGKAFLNSFVGQVGSSIKAEGFAGKGLVVAVSGGPDSTALLISLSSLRKQLDIKLHVAHLDHGLRKNSPNDQVFVSNLAKELELPYSTKKVNIKSLASLHGNSIEEEARNVRYQFLSDVMKSVDADAMALGHTSDDQVETILLHLVRGSGLRGLRGMTISSSYVDRNGSHIEIVRPLLPLERSETQEFCKLAGVLPRYDETNLNTSISRNYIRLHILPQLAILNPKVKAAILRLGGIAKRDLNYIESNLDNIWADLVVSGSGFLKIHRPTFLEHHQSIQFHLLQRAHSSVCPREGALEAAHLEQLLSAVKNSNFKIVELPRRVFVKVEKNFVTFTNNSNLFFSPKIHGSHLMKTSGETIVPCLNQAQGKAQKIQGWKFLADIPCLNESLDPNPLIAYLDYEKLTTPIIIRSRRPGDLFSPLGIKNETIKRKRDSELTQTIQPKNHRGKKLQDYLINARVPVDIRDSIPLVISGDRVAWVVGWRIANWARVTPQTKKVLRLESYPPVGGLTKPGNQKNPFICGQINVEPPLSQK